MGIPLFKEPGEPLETSNVQDEPSFMMLPSAAFTEFSLGQQSLRGSEIEFESELPQSTAAATALARSYYDRRSSVFHALATDDIALQRPQQPNSKHGVI